MSHIVTVQTEVRDHAAVAAACRRLALPEPVHGAAQLYSGQAEGLLGYISATPRQGLGAPALLLGF